MQITIDTNNLSELDIAMLGFLAGNTEEAEEVEETPAPTPEKKAAAKKAAAKAEVAPEPLEEDLVGEGPTMSDAVAAATALVSEGGAAKVKAALAVVGAKRVSEMAEADIPTFLAALEAAE